MEKLLPASMRVSLSMSSTRYLKDVAFSKAAAELNFCQLCLSRLSFVRQSVPPRLSSA